MTGKLRKEPYGCFICFCGIFLRFLAMSFGHNYDFESYCIVGEAASKLQNVYVVTERYNYSPAFLCIQGVSYQLAQILSADPLLTYRVLLVGILTFADLGIAYWICGRYSFRQGVIFFLNPVSIIITGYHNQFENIAILFALISCNFYSEEEKLRKKDFLFVTFLTLSLLIKHILYIFLFWILVRKHIPLKKKFVYVFTPPLVFLLSFVPFILHDRAAFKGILKHVFLYRSYNNAPLLGGIFHAAGVPGQYWFPIFTLIMMMAAFLIRGQSYEYQMMLYLTAMVTFSSAVANQYLVIPVAALCVLGQRIFRYGYIFSMGVFLFLDDAGFGVLSRLEDSIGHGVLFRAAEIFHKKAYCIGVWILLCFLTKEILQRNKGDHTHVSFYTR